MALHIHLSSDWHNLPAGTEILLGYSDAAASAHGGAAAARGQERRDSLRARCLARARRRVRDESGPARRARRARCPPATARRRTRATASRPTGIEAPPPGGFTLTPPVSPATQQQLTSPGYVFPVAGGAHYGHDFGNFRADTGFHEGSDLFAPEGTPLVAVQSGVLHNVGWNRLGGWRLWVEDAHGNWFYYAHLSAYSPIAKDDAHVNAGDVIGFVGNTGDAQGGPTHVHFEIHPGGQWAVPPYDYLQAWQGHRNPFAAIPTVLPQPPVAATELGSTDISAASGLETAAVLAVASGAPVDTGLVALGVPAPTAAELLASAPAPSP